MINKSFWIGLGVLMTGVFAFGKTIPYKARLSKQQEFLVGDVVLLEFSAEISEESWYLYSQVPYPALTTFRPEFAQGESSGIEWAKGDLSQSLKNVRATNDLTAPFIMNKHELVWSKAFKIIEKNAKITGTLSGSYKEGFGDSLETLNFQLPLSFEIEARDNTVKRTLEASEKINTVLAVVVTLFLGLLVSLFITQRKLKKLTALANAIKEEKYE